jgi:hypothetical protein
MDYSIFLKCPVEIGLGWGSFAEILTAKTPEEAEGVPCTKIGPRQEHLASRELEVTFPRYFFHSFWKTARKGNLTIQKNSPCFKIDVASWTAKGEASGRIT